MEPAINIASAKVMADASQKGYQLNNYISVNIAIANTIESLLLFKGEKNTFLLSKVYSEGFVACAGEFSIITKNKVLLKAVGINKYTTCKEKQIALAKIKATRHSL